jgi:hypothetical protein
LSLQQEEELAQLLTKATYAVTVERAGILLLKTLLTGNTNPVSFVFRHPNYYKQLKEKYEQEASSNKQQAGNDDPDLTRRVGPESGTKTQASSSKHQAPSSKPEACTKIRE